RAECGAGGRSEYDLRRMPYPGGRRPSAGKIALAEVEGVIQGAVASRYTTNQGVGMIEARGLTKRYGDKVAVDNLSFTVRPGIVTGFLGPNGAGKSTTMRLILGLDAPTTGDVTVNGKHYREYAAPLHEVGRCSRRGRCTAAAPPTTSCSPWRRPTGSRGGAL